MPLINCEISLQLKWSEECLLMAGTAGNELYQLKIMRNGLNN